MPASTEIGMVGLLNFGTLVTGTVSEAGELLELTMPTLAMQHVYEYVISTEGAPYTQKFALLTEGVLTNAILTLRLDFAATSDPTVRVYNEDDTGDLLQEIQGQAGAEGVFIFSAYFNGVAWLKLDGHYVV